MRHALCWLAIGLLGLVFHSTASANDVTLVKDGEPQCVIVVESQPIKSTCLAACELQLHLKKITGAVVPIVREDASPKGFPIYVGESKKVRELGLANDKFQQDEYAVKFFDDCIVLTGPIDDHERIGADQPLVVTQAPEHLGSQRGPLYAVYDFLERGCDVRWYMPGDIGLVCPSTKTLVVKSMDIHRRPVTIGRQTGFGVGLNMWGQVSKEDERLFNLRNKAGGRSHPVSHSFEGFPSRFAKGPQENPKAFESEHPEYFSKDQGTGQMCFSSPELLAQVIKDAREFFDGKGLKYRCQGDDMSYHIVPRDTKVACTCEKCQAQLGPDNGRFNSGRGSKLVWTFINNVAKAIAESHPGKSVAGIAYFDYACFPEGLTIEPNVQVGPALFSRDWVFGGKEDMKLYQDWVNACPGRIRSIWLYPCFPGETTAARGYHHFPALMPHKLAEHMKMFAKDRVMGFMMCGSWELLEYYLSLKYQDDPNRDTEAFIDEFFNRFYGNAAVPMKKIYLEIEETYWDPKNYPEGRSSCDQRVCWGTLGSTERMNRWQGYLDEAKVLAKTPEEQKRVALFDESLWAFMKQGKETWDFKAAHNEEVAKLRDQPPPCLTIPRIASVAEGKLANVDWSQIATRKIDRANDGYPSKDRWAELQWAHDGTNVYVHIYEHGDASKFGYDGWFWGHRWEVFYGDSRSGEQMKNAQYRQLAMRVGSKLDTWREPELYEGVQYQCSTDSKGWNMTLAIPLAKLCDAGVKPGGKFYMNIIRGAADGSSTLALNPIFQANFHCPDRFVEITLAE